MAVQQNTDHIQTTHIGSLPRPHNLLDLLKAKYAGQPYDESKLNSVLAREGAEWVRKQVECGIDRNGRRILEAGLFHLHPRALRWVRVSAQSEAHYIPAG